MFNSYAFQSHLLRLMLLMA